MLIRVYLNINMTSVVSINSFFLPRHQDPHGELQGQNVLIVRYSSELTAAHFGISVEKVTELLASARAKMAEVRKSRPRPHLDTKMLASWNG